MNLDAAKGCGTIHTYKMGSVLCKEGDDAHTAFIILRGAVGIVLNSFSANPEVVATLETGSFCGEMALLLGKPRTATMIIVEEDTIVLEIAKHNFRPFLQKDPDTCYKLLKTLRDRIDIMLEKLKQDEPRVVFQYKKNNLYQIANSINYVSFAEMAEQQPDIAIKLITGLCKSLDDFNTRYVKSKNPDQ